MNTSTGLIRALLQCVVTAGMVVGGQAAFSGGCHLPWPTPGPTPGPTPPPQPPAPDASFAAAVQAAYVAEPAADKAGAVKALASLYRAAATMTVNDAGIKTNGDLFADLKAVSPKLLDPAAIPGVRKAIGDRLNASLGLAAKPIDRPLAKAELTAVATALEGVK